VKTCNLVATKLKDAPKDKDKEELRKKHKRDILKGNSKKSEEKWR